LEIATVAQYKSTKKTRRSELVPGEATVWKNGRRWSKKLDGGYLVQAWVWSPTLGRKLTATFDLDEDAKDWQARERTGRVHGQEVDPKKSKQSFALTAAEWFRSKPFKGIESAKTDRDRLKGTGVVVELENMGDLYIGEDVIVTIVGKPTGFAAQPTGRINTAQVLKLIDIWKLDDRPNYVAGRFSTLRAIFLWAEDANIIPKWSSPCRGIKTQDMPKWRKPERPVHRPDNANDDDFIMVRSVSNDDLINLAVALGPDYELMCWLGIAFGARYEEAAGLTVESVEGLMKGLVKITQVMTRQGKLKPVTKTEAGDRFIVDEILAPKISAHMRRRGITLDDPPETPLFVNARTGGTLTYNAWRNIWINALDKVGLDWRKRNGQRLGMHDLRSMNHSIMTATGVDQTTSRFRFGHADGNPQSRMDDWYSRTTVAQVREASEKVHSRLRMVPLENQAQIK
jgi:hypothetical protein